MVKLDSNVVAFNKHYLSLIQQLKAHSKSFKDLNQIIYLMKGYMACEDEEFVAYMKAKKHHHNNGKQILDPNLLQADAISFYDIAVESKQWKKTLQLHQQIVALTAQLEKLVVQNNRLSKKLPKKDAKQDGNKRKQDNKSSDQKSFQPKPQRHTPDWMKKAPSDGKTTMTKEGKEWKWCDHHKLWGQHLEAECEVNDHVTRGHWEFVCKEDIPMGTKILPMVWSMKRKRKILTGEPYR